MKTHLMTWLVATLFQLGLGYEFRIDKRCSTFVQNLPAMKSGSTEQGGSEIYKVGKSTISDEKRAGIWKEAKKVPGMTQERIEKEDGESVYVLEIPENEEKELYRLNWHFPSKPTKSLTELEEDGKRKLGLLLPSIAGEFRFANHEVEYEGINGDQVITEVRLRFARLLDGSEVMKRISYLYLDMDGRGKVKRIKMRYPEIVKSSRSVADFRNSKDVLLDLTQHCAMKSHVGLMEKADVDKIKSTEVTASVRSWLPLASEDGDILLTPSVSFFSQMDVEGEEKFSKVIHVPLDKSLYIDDGRTRRVVRKSEENGVFVQRGTEFAPVIKSGR